MDIWLTCPSSSSALPLYFECYFGELLKGSVQRASLSCVRSLLDCGAVRSAVRFARRRFDFNVNGGSYMDEVHLVLMALVEAWSLRSTGGLLSETMHGMTRGKVFTTTTRTPTAVREVRQARNLTFWQGLAAAALETSSFYIKNKMADKYRELSNENENNNDNNDNNDDVYLKTFKYLYPFLHLTQESISFLYGFAYLFKLNKSVFFTPLLHLLGQTVRRTTMQDVRERKALFRSPNISALLKGLAVACPAFLAAFFVSGWVSNAMAEVRRVRGSIRRTSRGWSVANGTSIMPPPAPLLDFLPSSLRSSILCGKHKCPVCLCAPRVNPTVCSDSGFVFCYKCVVRHVRRKGECPVTRIKTTERKLIRLFENG